VERRENELLGASRGTHNKLESTRVMGGRVVGVGTLGDKPMREQPPSEGS
jgi:hypothetical protein